MKIRVLIATSIFELGTKYILLINSKLILHENSNYFLFFFLIILKSKEFFDPLLNIYKIQLSTISSFQI